MNAVIGNDFHRNTLADLFMIFAGSLMWVIALVCLIVPSGSLSVGFSGIGILITDFVSIPLSVVFFVLNVPFLLLAWKEWRKRYFFYSLFALISQSLLMALIGAFLPVYTGDRMLSVVFAGILGGFGFGLASRYGGNSCGVEVIAILMKKRFGFSAAAVSAVFNGIVLCLCALFYGLEPAMYTLIFIAVFFVVKDKAIAGMGKNYTAMIISSHPEEVKDVIFNRLHRGVTILRGKSAVSGDQRDVLYTALNPRELEILKEMVREIDPGVFITIHETAEIFGYFRKKNRDSFTMAQVDDFLVEDAQRPIAAQVDYYEHTVKVINRHGAEVGEAMLPGEFEDGEYR